MKKINFKYRVKSLESKSILLTAVYSLLSICMIFTSCNLNEYPEDSISPETYFKNEQELKLYSNQFYIQLPDASEYYQEMSDLVCNTLAIDNSVLGYTHVVPGTGGGWSFSALRHINYMLGNIDRCTDKRVRNQYEGVCRFFRAYFYFDKLQHFGEVPWYEEVVGSADNLLYKPRDTRDYVIGMINRDLDSAAVLLPETPESNMIVGRYAALALQARANLYEGTFRKYHNGRVELNNQTLGYGDLLQKAADAARKVMSSNKYAIYSSGNIPYYDLFVNNDPSNKEYILKRSYAVATHGGTAYALVSSKGAAGATRTLALAYLMKDGSRFTDKAGYDTYTYQQEYADRDPRMAQTLLTKSFTYKDGTKATFNKGVTLTGYPIVKYVEGSTMIPGSHVDVPVLRYAEVLLAYAEAKAELGTLTQSDIDISINVVRGRVGMPALNLAAANANPDPVLLGAEFGYLNVDKGSNCGVILEIRRERTIEMAMEGNRYQDLVRWRELTRFDNQNLDGTSNGHNFLGVYVTGSGKFDMDGDGTIDFVVNKQGDRPQTAPGVTSVTIDKDIFLDGGVKGHIIALKDIYRRHDENRDYLYPIPTTELALSKGALNQNPNWDDIDR